MIPRYALLLSFLFSFYGSNAQTKTIEQLKHNIQSAKTPGEQMKTVLDLCDQGYSLHPDTLMLYAQKAQKIAVEQNNVHDIARAMYYESFALTNKGLIDSSLKIANQCLQLLYSKINDGVLLANVLNQKGRCFMRKNQYKEAIDMGYQVIVQSEKSGDVLLQIKGATLVGWAYLEMGQPKEALLWHLKALHTTTDTLLLQKYSILYANLALNYNGLGKSDSSFYFIKKAIAYSRKYENLFALSNSLAIQSQLFVRTGQPKLAEKPLKEVVEIRELIGDPFYIVSDMAQLGLYYAHYGQPEKGVSICNEGIAIANKYNIGTKLFFLYSTLAENYKALGNNAGYAEVLEKIIILKDSVYQSNSTVVLAEMQTKYELQKKENIIIQQKLDLVQKNYFIYATLGLLFISMIAGYIIITGFRKRQKLKMQFMRHEEKRIAMQAVLEAEEAERKRIAADLHDNLGSYAASIASNIDYLQMAEKGRQDIAALKELRNNSQEMVSQLNDTIWALKKDALPLTAISDRVKFLIQKIQYSYPNTTIDLLEDITKDHILSPAAAFHLFQIIKEAINNALRHSNGNNINVVIKGHENWRIVVTDDGKGLAVNNTNSEGSGLFNMKKRSADAGFKINWVQNEPAGTKVIIEAA